MFNIFGFFSRDKSSEWTECFKIPISLNMQTGSLNGVQIGDSYEKLRIFGRPNNRSPFRNNRFIYYPLGLEIETVEGQIAIFSLITNESVLEGEKQKFANCEFSLTAHNGKQLNVNKFTNLAAVEQLFGISPEKDSDEELDFIIAPYSQGNLTLEFQFYFDGTLEKVDVEPAQD